MKRIHELFFCYTATAILTMFLSAGTANAATFSVNTVSDTVDAVPGNGACADSNGNCSFRAALMEANALAGNETINLPAGVFTQSLTATADENLNAGGDWDIASNITINGVNPSSTYLQAAVTSGTASERVLDVRSGVVVISGVTIRNGRFAGAVGGPFSLNGAGVQNLGDLTLNDVIVRDNLQNRDVSGGTMAGGIYNGGAAITINNSTITGNQCNNAIDNCRGGGMYSYPFPGSPNTTVTINNSHFDGNSSAYSGASGFGGFAAGFGAGSSTSAISITDSSFNNNSGTGRTSWGAGFEVSATAAPLTISVSGSSFDNNTVSTANGGSGVGVLMSARSAGPITATFDKTSISGNSGNSTGGGVQLVAVDGNLTCSVTNSAINNNSAGSQGGGILVGNQSSNPTVEMTLNLTNSTVSGNSSKTDGGGLFIFRSGAAGSPPATANINFSTIANNKADSDNSGSGDGGGISANVATNEGTINLKNSIVADNSDFGGQAPDIFRTVISGGYNHIENAAGAIFAAGAGDLTSSDPEIGSLALNGGTTMNQLPASTSPVLNSIPPGTNDCGTITTDQKGVVRPFGGGCDKGATERGLIIVTSSNLPTGIRGFSYNTPIVADYGQPAYSYSVSGGATPPGLTLQSDGTWAGVPTAGGIYNFTVQANDSAPLTFGQRKTDISALAPNTVHKNFRLQIVVPTAAQVSVSGRVTTADGRGIRNALLFLTDIGGSTRVAQTGSLGFYSFEDVQAGRSYTVTVSARRFDLMPSTRVIAVSDDLTDIDFTAQAAVLKTR